MDNNENIKEDDPATLAAAQEIERLSLQLITTVNARDWTFNSPSGREILSRIASDFRLVSPTSDVQSWEQAVHEWQQKSLENPDLHVEVTHVSSSVQLSRGQAAVYIQSEVKGAGDNVTFAWLSQRLWRFDGGQGKWMMYEMSGMRGTQSLMGFV